MLMFFSLVCHREGRHSLGTALSFRVPLSSFTSRPVRAAVRSSVALIQCCYGATFQCSHDNNLFLIPKCLHLAFHSGYSYPPKMILCTFSVNAILGDCLMSGVTFLPMSTSDDVLDFSGLLTFLSQMLSRKHFLGWEKEGEVVLVSSGGNYQYGEQLFFVVAWETGRST